MPVRYSRRRLWLLVAAALVELRERSFTFRRSLIPGLVAASSASPVKAQSESSPVAQRDQSVALPFTIGPEVPAPEDVSYIPEDAQVTKSGLAFKVLEDPDCETAKECKSLRPTQFDEVEVEFTGWQPSGKMFDSSVGKRPAKLALAEVIKGWQQGLKTMVPGEKRRFWIPSKLAYGDKGEIGRPAGDLVFDILLLSIKRGARAPPTPDDVDAVPADAVRSSSGLASKVLKAGLGKSKPKQGSTVNIDFTGWNTDGDIFDSTVLRGRPESVLLQDDAIIKGLQEGIQLMVIGESRRFWVPPNLQTNVTKMSVYDVKLYRIE